MQTDFTYSNRRYDTQTEVSESIGQLISAIDDLLRSTASYGGAEIELARSKLNIQLENLRRYTAQYQQSAAEYCRQACASADAYVHENPWQAAAIAGGVGAFIGMCMSSGSRR